MFRVIDLQVLLPNPNYQKNIDNTSSSKYNIGVYPVMLPEDVYLKLYDNSLPIEPTKLVISSNTDVYVSSPIDPTKLVMSSNTNINKKRDVSKITSSLNVEISNLEYDFNNNEIATPVISYIDQLNEENNKNKDFINSIDIMINKTKEQSKSLPIKKRKVRDYDFEEGEVIENVDYDASIIKIFVDKILEISKNISPIDFYIKIDNSLIDNYDYYINYLDKYNQLHIVLDKINRLHPNNIDIIRLSSNKHIFIVNYNFNKNLPSNDKSKYLSIRIIEFCDNVIEWINYCLMNDIYIDDQYKYLDKNVIKYSYFYFFSDPRNIAYWNNLNLPLPIDVLYTKIDKNINIKYEHTTKIVYFKRI